MESAIVPPDGVAFSYADGSLALSRDGQQLAFVARAVGGEPTLWIRSLSSSAARQFQGTEGAHAAFWSPDGKYVVFAAKGKLKKIGVSGGAPETLADVSGVSGGTWLPNGDILYASNGGILRVSSAGGTPTVVVKPGTDPQQSCSASRREALSLRSFRAGEGTYIGSLDGERGAPFDRVYSQTLYVPQDSFSIRATATCARSCSTARNSDSQESLCVSGSRAIRPRRRRCAVAVSDNGTLVYAEGRAGKSLTDVRNGKPLGTLAAPRMFFHRGCRTTKKVAVDQSDSQAKGDIWSSTITTPRQD